ncbi:Spy0128 family protein [Paratractidigestivibacter sp.]|uniref:Spy0128 family protein n=1 Tax=Paratractidigestivibacter sp. TaxID=2847316 RepID=UPI003AB7A33D
MNFKRGRFLCVALCAVFAALVALCFRGVAFPVHAEEAPEAPAPIQINQDTAKVTVTLYTDEGHLNKLNGPVTSISQFYGAFSAEFLTGKAPKTGDNVAVYEFPDTIVVDNNDGGDLMAGSGTDAKKAGTWKIEDNKVIFTFDEDWLKLNPAGIYVAANFSFQLADRGTGSGGGTSVVFPGAGSINIHTKDGKVRGTKEGAFSQGADGVAKVTWTVKLTVESYATNVKFTDVLGDNFSFVDGSFMLDGKKLEPQPTITGQNATLDSLGNLSQGDHTITYETVLKGDVSVNNGDFINDQEASKNTASWEWGGANDRQNGTVTAAPSKFRYDMINKSNGSGTPSDISWTVKLNQGELKADMRGYVFTDTLDEKQTYTGSYTVYKGDSGSEVIETGVLGSTQSSFTYTFPSDLADRYATYCIVYHTKMKDASSYDTVRNSAVINRKGSVSGTDDGAFTPQLVGTPITKNLLSSEDAATTGRATWKTRVALKAIVNAVNPDKVTVKDTFQSAWSQNLGVDEGSITIKIGETVLARDADWRLTGNWPVGGTKRNFNLDIIVNDRVKAALKNEDYAVITYTTTSDALPGWYSNFASVSAPGLNLQRQYTDLVMYVVNQETTPAVEKPEAESKVSWDEDFDWNAVDGSAEKGAWVVDWTVYANRQKGQKNAKGEFEYYGAGKLNGAPLNIIDTLPDGMSYVAGSARYTLVQNPYNLHTGLGGGSEAKTVVTDQQLVADNVSSNGNTVTFSIPTTAIGNYAGYAKLTYKTAVKRSELNTSTNEAKFTNSASAESGSKKFDSGSGIVTVKNNVIQKTGEQLGNSNRIKYTILVNESAVDLMAGSDILELVDTMDAKCTLVPSTLKVYEYGNVVWKELAEGGYSSKVEQVESADGPCARLTLKVPDGKYLKVEYEVIPSGNPGDQVLLSNTAKLTGVTEGSATDKKTWTVKNAAASAGGNGYGITMTKYDAQQVGATLEGAEFKLYSVDMGRAATDAIENSRELFQTAKTNANGKISFGTSEKAMNSCVLYQLVETRAPDGYAVAAPTWIMLKGSASGEDYQAALTKAKTIVGGAEIIDDTKKDEIWVYDNRMTGTAVISAKKVLEGGTFKNGQFSFTLKDSDGKVLQTATNDAEGNVSFNVEYNKAGEYRYTISEVVPEGAENNVKDHIAYDTTVHNVLVTVKNGDGKLDAAVTYDNDSTTPPTFTNKYSTTLPAAGGSGTTATYLAGAVLLAIAAVRMHLYRAGAKKGGESRE